MNIDISRLENVRQREGKLVARCPACVEKGHDNTGNHLCVYDDGRFACCVYPGASGKEHRKRILELVGACGRYGGRFVLKVRPTRHHIDGTVGTLFSWSRA